MWATILAAAVAIAFLWSIVLFLGAVFLREREQQAGFGYALIGAVVYFVTFCDRLPRHSYGPRDLLTHLPGVGAGDVDFTSSALALMLLAAIYVLRVAVFYQLILRDVDVDQDGDRDLVDDYVAPPLSYLCLAICIVALLVPLYSLGWLATILLVIVLLALYFLRMLKFVLDYLGDLVLLAIVGLSRGWRGIQRLVVHITIAIAKVEMRRRGPEASSRFHDWAVGALNSLQHEAAEARTREGELLSRIAKRVERSKTGGKP